MNPTISDFARQQFERLNTEGHQGIVDAFDEAVREFGDRNAFVCLGRASTFTDIERSSRALAAWLLGAGGLQPGDRIAIQLPNLTQYPIAAWAAIRAGLIIVNTNPMYTARELKHQFTDSGAKALIVLADLLPLVEHVVPETEIDCIVATNAADLVAPAPLPASALANLTSFTDALAAGEGLVLPEQSATMDDIAVLQYTSGTTGVAKGAILTQGNLYASKRMGEETFVDTDNLVEVAIAPMPLYHIYGFAVNVISGVLKGSLSVLVPNARDIDDLLNTMNEHPFTLFTGINTLFASMMQHPQFDSIDFSHLRRTVSGGSAQVQDIADEWLERTGTPIYEGYGLSESAAGGSVNTPEHSKLGTVGKPLVASELRVVDEGGKDVAAGECGELQIRGPHITPGYWQRPEATAEVIDGSGWFSTGDVAVIGEDGFVKIVDRIKDMVLVSGFNVYPNEIENVVHDLDGVTECAVVGVPDEHSGEAVKLFVACTDATMTEEKIRDYCREQLGAYKVPKHIEFRDELPKSVVGKILRRELRDPTGG